MKAKVRGQGRGRGRPSKLSPDRVARLLGAIRQGMHIHIAAQYAGIDQSTFHLWMARGKDEGVGEFYDFFKAVQDAEIESELSALVHWRSAFPRDWRAAEAMMRRRHPDRWAVTQENHAPEVKVIIKNEDDEREPDRDHDRPAKATRRAKRDS